MKTALMKWTLGLSAAALSIGGIAHAQQTSHGKSMMDTNGDGVVTRAEAEESAAALFEKLDVNHDGKLDQADRDARREEMRSRMFDKLDTNHDGSISKAEFMAHEDADGDHHRMDGPGKDGAGKFGHGMRGMHGGMMMAMADANHDRVVTKDEFVAAALKRFDMMDTNHDGQVSKEERQAAREKMKAQWMSGKSASPGAD